MSMSTHELQLAPLGSWVSEHCYCGSLWARLAGYQENHLLPLLESQVREGHTNFLQWQEACCQAQMLPQVTSLNSKCDKGNANCPEHWCPIPMRSPWVTARRWVCLCPLSHFTIQSTLAPFHPFPFGTVIHAIFKTISKAAELNE